MKRGFILTLVLSGTLLTLTACGTVREQLGLTRRTPDEFAVITRAPLQIPTNLNEVTSLPPPQIGAPRPQEVDPRIAAKQALGVPVEQAQTLSASENSLLQKVGQGQNNIRTLVDKEAEKETQQRPVVQRLMNIGSDKKAATIVDPALEKERLKQGVQSPTPSKVD